MNYFCLPTLLLALVLPLLAGCPSLFEVSEDDDPEYVRIILGKSIDDVEIGDDSTTVIANLGEPDEIALGDYAGYFFLYTRGKHNGISVTIHSEKGAQAINVRSPYSGVTETGIGIGTSREMVVRILGDTDLYVQLNNHRVQEIYDYETSSFNVVYNGGSVEAIGMGGSIEN